MFYFVAIFSIDNIDATNQMFPDKLQIVPVAACPDQPGAALLVHLADEDHAVKEVDVTLRGPPSALDHNVKFAL